MALPINIDDLINSRTVESVRIEFKKGWNPEDVIRTMCAFANDINEYGSGYIVVGIEEKDGTPILPPSGLQKEQVDSIQKKFVELCNLLTPKIFPIIEPIEFMGQYIVVIWVTVGEERPYSAPATLGKGAQYKIYVRQGSTTIIATPLLENRLRELSAYRHFDDRINTKASIDDFDLGLIQAYLQEIKSSLYVETLKLSLSDIALKMQIARKQGESIYPLNVGLLLFCKEPHRFFEGCKTNLVEFEDESGTRYSEKTFIGPVHIQIREIMGYLDNNIIKQYTHKFSTKSEVDKFFNYPYQALEEVVVNSLYHRSYENPTPNEIRIYKSFKKGVINAAEIEDSRRIEVLSYPGPLPPIDEKTLIQLKVTARNYRNIKLGDWLKNLRLAEKYATGIPTIVDSLSTNGSPIPILSTDEARSFFLAVIRINESTPIEVDEDIAEIERIPLSNNQQRILEKLIEEPSLEDEILKELTEDAKADISFLLDKKLISSKKMENINLYHITSKGVESLKQSF
jgi:ATP-dependent DNA helicase RecG